MPFRLSEEKVLAYMWEADSNSEGFRAYIAAQEIHHLGKSFADFLALRTPDTFCAETIKSKILAVGGIEQGASGRECKLHVLLGGNHMNATQDLSQLCSCSAAAMASVAHDHSWLALPLVVQVIDGVLENRRVAPVILWADEDEAVVALDFLAPFAGVGVCVFGVVMNLRGDVGLVEEGKIPLGEVDDLEGRLQGPSVLVCRLNGLEDEVGNLWIGTRLPRRADHHGNSCNALRHDGYGMRLKV